MKRHLSILALAALCVLCVAPLLPDVTTVTTKLSRDLLRQQTTADMRTLLEIGEGGSLSVSNVAYATNAGLAEYVSGNLTNRVSYATNAGTAVSATSSTYVLSATLTNAVSNYVAGTIRSNAIESATWTLMTNESEVASFSQNGTNVVWLDPSVGRVAGVALTTSGNVRLPYTTTAADYPSGVASYDFSQPIIYAPGVTYHIADWHIVQDPGNVRTNYRITGYWVSTNACASATMQVYIGGLGTNGTTSRAGNYNYPWSYTSTTTNIQQHSQSLSLAPGVQAAVGVRYGFGNAAPTNRMWLKALKVEMW
jgi:hypothetical protein